MPPERISRSRQEPLSCERCRSKKLKCDRTHPCHNCTTRETPCVFSGRAARTTASTATGHSSDTIDSLRAENAEIKARLQRLEDTILDGGRAIRKPSAETQSVSSNVTLSSWSDGAQPRHAVDVPTFAYAKTGPQPVDRYHVDSQWLEGAGARMIAFAHLPENVQVNVKPLHEIIEQICTNTDVPSNIFLPFKEQLVELFGCYVEQLDALQHVIYVPTVRAMIDRLYDAFGSNTKVEYSHLALILGILASITGHWGHNERPQLLFEPCEKALPLAMFWLRCSLDILQYIWRNIDPDLATVQTTIIVTFLIYHTEGISSRLRLLQATAIANAKGMGLHTTDVTLNDHAHLSREEIIEIEVRRRVWWHLASTEWSSALSGGPTEGTYSVDPKHMHVKRPRNINDEDLVTKAADFTRPLSEPTIMSYYIQRIRLAELSRDVADVTWELTVVRSAASIAYELILELDQRFSDLLSGLPDFLRFCGERDMIGQSQDDSHPQIRKQKYFIYMTIQARRSKLHLPFLLRVAQDARYQYSREVSLRSARNVLQLWHMLPSQPSVATNVRLIGVLHHFFIATVVLVMDFCVNRDPGEEDARKAELRDAIKLLETAKERSPAASAFLDSIDTILQKHRVGLKGRISTSGDASHGATMPDSNATLEVQTSDTTAQLIPGNAAHTACPGQADVYPLDLTDMEFDQLWQGYFDFGTYADPQSWDALFSDLDMRINWPRSWLSLNSQYDAD